MHPSMFTVNKNVSEMTDPLSFCMGSMALMALGGMRWLNINVSVTVARRHRIVQPGNHGLFVFSRRCFISLLSMALSGKFGLVWSPVKKHRGSFHGRNCIMSKALFSISVFFLVYFIFNGKKDMFIHKSLFFLIGGQWYLSHGICLC